MKDGFAMHHYTQQELEEALQPIASLISKSEKAQQKVEPGTWQHTMLAENLKALRIASALMSEGSAAAGDIAPDDLRDSLRAIGSMIGRTEKAWPAFAPGTSQHTLLANRLSALRLAEQVVSERLARG